MPAQKPSIWKRRAERLANILPRERLHPAVLDWAAAAPEEEPWAVAFSGGADSLALLLLLWAHWPARRRRLQVLHFDHGLRGAASKADEAFSRRVCVALRVKFRAGVWLPARLDVSEAEARSARHAFFSEQMAGSGAKALWLGQQQDDVAETMLMRLARGSGPSGLAAPRPVQRMPGGKVHLRLLLSVKKEEIVAALREISSPWREDATNWSGEFFRNRVRSDVLPVWRSATADRDALAGVALSRELIEEDDDALEAWLDELNVLGPGGTLRLRRLAGKPRGLVRRALQRWLARHGRAGVISRQSFNILLGNVLCARKTRHSLGKNVFAEIGKTTLRLTDANGNTPREFHGPAN